MSEDSERQRLRTAVHDQLGATDPATMALLWKHPYREAILDRAADALAESLTEARQEQADPEPAASDLAELYRQIPPDQLTATLTANLVGDRDYWLSQMRYTPELLGQGTDEEETVVLSR